MKPKPEPTVVHQGPLTILGEVALDAIRALSVPDQHGRWDLHRWDGAR